jgi:glutathione S-transferase
MPDLELIVGPRNYSSWSMRPAVLLRESGLVYRETVLAFLPEGGIVGIEGRSPTGQVPALWIDGDCVWDSLAICETVAELVPERALWPVDPVTRRVARAVSAEMHSGFRALRSDLPMNLRATDFERPRSADAERDIARIAEIWTTCRERFGAGGSMLFGGFTCADAMFAPVAARLRSYGPRLPDVAQAYADALLDRASVRDWTALAAQDPTVLQRYERQRTAG